MGEALALWAVFFGYFFTFFSSSIDIIKKLFFFLRDQATLRTKVP